MLFFAVRMVMADRLTVLTDAPISWCVVADDGDSGTLKSSR